MRILALALGIPFPPIGGGLTRTFHLLKSLASHHDVALAAFTYGERHDHAPFPIRLEAVPWQWSESYRAMIGPDPEASRRAYERLTYEDDAPWFASIIDPAAMETSLAKLLTPQPDLVLLEGTPLAMFLPALPRDVPRVLDFFDVHSVMTRRLVEQAGTADRAAAAREAERTLVFERHAAQGCAACLAVSEEDATALRTLLGATHVHVVPNGVDTSYFTTSSVPPEEGAVLFTGRMSYEPNADAACYFAEEVLPLVRRELPAARFHVVGASPPPRVTNLASDAVIVHGRVSDVRPYLWRAEVVVVPVRAGGGTRLKVLEAAASGKAIVSTPLGVEGLPFRSGHDVLVGDAPAELAAAVVALLRDPRSRATLGARARAVACQFDWAAIGESFRAVVEEIVQRKGARRDVL